MVAGTARGRISRGVAAELGTNRELGVEREVATSKGTEEPPGHGVPDAVANDIVIQEGEQSSVAKGRDTAKRMRSKRGGRTPRAPRKR